MAQSKHIAFLNRDENAGSTALQFNQCVQKLSFLQWRDFHSSHWWREHNNNITHSYCYLSKCDSVKCSSVDVLWYTRADYKQPQQTYKRPRDHTQTGAQVKPQRKHLYRWVKNLIIAQSHSETSTGHKSDLTLWDKHVQVHKQGALTIHGSLDTCTSKRRV